MMGGHFVHKLLFCRKNTASFIHITRYSNGWSDDDDVKTPEGFMLASHSTEFQGGPIPKIDIEARFWDWGTEDKNK
jgi:hypothetical protein